MSKCSASHPLAGVLPSPPRSYRPAGCLDSLFPCVTKLEAAASGPFLAASENTDRLYRSQPHCFFSAWLRAASSCSTSHPFLSSPFSPDCWRPGPSPGLRVPPNSRPRLLGLLLWRRRFRFFLRRFSAFSLSGVKQSSREQRQWSFVPYYFGYWRISGPEGAIGGSLGTRRPSCLLAKPRLRKGLFWLFFCKNGT